MSRQTWIRLFFSLAMLPVAITSAPAQSRSPLFQSTGVFAADTSRPNEIRRSRYITVDAAQLTPAAADRINRGAPANDPDRRLTLNLFGDAAYEVIIDRVERSSHGGADVWVGHIPGLEHSSVFIGISGSTVIGNIKTGNGDFYQIRYSGTGQLHMINDVDESRLPRELPPVVPNVPAVRSADEPRAAPDSGAIIDVMVVYTPAARAAAGGTTAIQTLIQTAIAETNQGYQNSQVAQRINLVYSGEVPYTEAATDPFGSALSSVAFGALNTVVLPLRNQYRADLVSLWINNNSYCGLGYVMTNVNSSFEPYGYSVVYQGCATGYYSFAHEMGHNEGTQHDRANASGTGAYLYSYGYQQLDASPRFRTIMAYDCTGGCARLNYWSNPAVLASVSGPVFPTGVIGAAATSADNRLTLNNTALTVANFRQGSAPGLGITKRHTGSFTQGQQNAVYTLTVSNAANASAATSGAVTVTETVPSGLSLVSMSGTGWLCVTNACTRIDSLSPGANYPDITVLVNVAVSAASPQVNAASVSGGGSPAIANTTDSTIVNPGSAPDLTLTKSHTGNFRQAQTGAAYAIAVRNTGNAGTSGTVTVTDSIPGGLIATAITGAGWLCTQPAGPCTRQDSLAANGSYPAITLTVDVAPNAPASLTNTASVAGGGETNTGNNSSSDATVITALPVFAIGKTHSGQFTQGQTGAAYSITVQNSAAAGPTTGAMVTVSDTLPAGLTATAIAGGATWSCTQPAGPCTRSDVLPAGSSYPAITVTVNVASNASPTVTNNATVSGGGAVAGAAASDVTTIAPRAASIATAAGTPQSTGASTSFGAALQAKVLDGASNPVAGATVTFTAPASGASATFNGNLSAAAVTNGSGIAISPVPVANVIPGAYTVTASVTGLSPASFSLTNTAAPAITVTVAPKTVTLGPSGQQAFTAGVAVKWSLSPDIGTMNGSTYTAPATIASAQTVILTATSQADSNAKDTAAITLTPPDATLFPANSGPFSCNAIGAGTELGLKFRSDVAGQIRGLRFYKNGTDNTAHMGTLWSAAGVVLATVAFTNETASGWQQMLFANPVQIAANTTYIASYHTNGWYCSSAFALMSAGVDNPPLHGLKDGVDGANGVYAASPNGGIAPNQANAATNYWVDVLFAAAPAQTAGSIVVVSGTGQSTPVGTSFGAALKAKVLDTLSNPMAGATVTFTAPGAGASALLNGNPSLTAVTDAAGIAASPAPVANAAQGGYTVNATVAGVVNPARFSLTNAPPPQPVSLVAAGGTPQNTPVNTSFGSALQARVLDVSSNPVAGVTVTFTAPGLGASATFNGAVSTTAVTNGFGIAVSPVPGANATAGAYTVTAAVTGLAPASFSLTNTNAPSITVTVAPKTVTLGPSGQQAFTANTAVTWSLSPNTGTMNGSTYTAPPAIASPQTVILTATSQADGNAKDTAAITLQPPDATIFPGNSAPLSCNGIGSGTELGLKFRSDVAGLIRGIRFYKNATDASSHTGTLWSAAGVALAAVAFTNETASGWQQMLFANPVQIAANTTYIASYHTSGWYCSSAFALLSAGVDNPPLHALKDGADGPNGVYAPSQNGGIFPSQASVASNFWVDVLLAAAPSQTAGSIVPVSGTPQSTPAGTSFGAALKAKVLDTSANPMAGIMVTFTAPGSGASAAFNGGAAVTAATDASGVAASPVPLANAITGAYTVNATVAGVVNPAQFSLTNGPPPPPASIVAVGGTPQSTVAGTTFGAALQAKVLDASSNPVAGVTVTFAAPGAGASAAFNGNVSAAAVTNGFGIAVSPAPVANAITGGYAVTASVTGLAPATFSLTNTNAPLITVTVTPKSVTLGPSGQQAFTANTAVTWSLPPNMGTMNGNTYTAPATIASAQTVILTATSQADGNAKDTAAITLQPPDATVFPVNSSPFSCNTVGSGTELGLKFRSDVAGQIRGVRFYKNAADNTPHTGTLWSAAGVALATGRFTNETASGWQQMLFSNPVQIAANTTYIASYHTNGWYCLSAFAFSSAGVDNPPLHALKDGVDGPNGVYAANPNGGIAPNQGFVSSNYWVDVLFLVAP